MSLNLQFQTLAEALYFEAKAAGETRGVTFIDDDGDEEVVTYLQVLEEARGTAAALARRGLAPGAPLVLILPTGPDFLPAFFGALLAGAVPCAISPPGGFGDLDAFADRAADVVAYLGAPVVLTTRSLSELLAGRIDAARVIDAVELRVDVAAHGAAGYAAVERRPDDLAYIQCTSGSTGRPKGVMLTHENIISNLYQMGWAEDLGPSDAFVVWLPLYHDMGLFASLLCALYWNVDCVFMSPFRFLRRPVEWLRAISRHKGTITLAPNFAYRVVTARVRDAELAGLDLSTLKAAYCGAEPIDPRTLHAFAARFAAVGLRPTAPLPCYGLAEGTVAVTARPHGKPFAHETVSRRALAEDGIARLLDTGAAGNGAAAAGGDVLEIVSCGPPLMDTRLQVVDEAGRPLPERRVGEVEVRGPSVFKGYYGHDEATSAAFRHGWLRTGDLGYLAGGELFVTGRRKDILKVRGRLYLPSDFEWAAEEVEGVRKGAVVAVGIFDPDEGTERLHMAVEPEKAAPEPAEATALAAAIADHVAARTSMRPAAVHIVARGAVPKTTSGKLRRSEMKAQILSLLAAPLTSTKTSAAVSP